MIKIFKNVLPFSPRLVVYGQCFGVDPYLFPSVNYAAKPIRENCLSILK